MNKALLLLLLLSVSLFARFSATPLESCEAYNNMRHSKNSRHVVLDPARKYTVLKRHKGQYLILLKGETPAQRWVDGSCFSVKNIADKKSIKSKDTKKYQNDSSLPMKRAKQALLVLSWHNAFCETHPRKQECQRDNTDKEGQLVLHGLWPQPRNNVYCGVPKKIVSKDKFHQWKALPNIDIEPSTLELMERWMPGYLSRLHKHEWIKHGTCYGRDTDSYYKDALTMTKAVDSSRVGELLRKHIGKTITLGKIREAFDKSFGRGTGKKVEMKCDGRLLSELWISMGMRGETLSERIRQGKPRKSRCRKAVVDAK